MVFVIITTTLLVYGVWKRDGDGGKETAPQELVYVLGN